MTFSVCVCVCVCVCVFLFFVFVVFFLSQDSRGRGRLSLQFICTTSTRFTDTQILTDISRAITVRELTSAAHNQQPDSNREPLVSERKSLTSEHPHSHSDSLPYYKVVRGLIPDIFDLELHRARTQGFTDMELFSSIILAGNPFYATSLFLYPQKMFSGRIERGQSHGLGNLVSRAIFKKIAVAPHDFAENFYLI